MFRSYLTRVRAFPKKKKKKIKKHHSCFISRQIEPGQAEKEIKKNFVLSSVPTRPKLEHSQKNSKKIQKIKKTSF